MISAVMIGVAARRGQAQRRSGGAHGYGRRIVHRLTVARNAAGVEQVFDGGCGNKQDK
jgi:hypothetical protein